MSLPHRVVVLAALGAASFTAAACSLLVSTSGLAGMDPSGDAGGGVLVTSDGGRDAAGCEGGGFCACASGAHTFCDDFDSVPTGAAWTLSHSSNGTIGYDDSGTFSPPVSVLATSNAVTSGNLRQSISLIATPTVTRLRVEVDMAIEQGDPVAGVGTHGFCPIVVTLQPGSQTIRLNIYAERADVEQLVATKPVDLRAVDVPTRTGARARYGLWLDTKARTCGVTVDGVEKLQSCVLDAAFKGGAASVSVGIEFVRPPTDALKVRFDNVTIDHD